MKRIRLGTRKSALAMAQTHWVESLLLSTHSDLFVDIIDPIDTTGDINLTDHPKNLVKICPGLFKCELEAGLYEGIYDACVHSLKDVPTTCPPGLKIVAITKREDPRDVVVIRKDLVELEIKTLEDLPNGSIIGTSSVRREAMLRYRYKHKSFVFKLIRGNVNSRLAKLDKIDEETGDGDYAAIILALAGLNRLAEKDEEIRNRLNDIEILNPEKFYYGVGQGSLGIECKLDFEHFHHVNGTVDEATEKHYQQSKPKMSESRIKEMELVSYLKTCEDFESAIRCTCERGLLRKLEGGCQIPVGVWTDFAKVKNEDDNNNNNTVLYDLKVGASVLDEMGTKMIEQQLNCKFSMSKEDLKKWEEYEKFLKQANEVGEQLAEKLLENGAKEILDRMGLKDDQGEKFNEYHGRNLRRPIYGNAEDPNLDARPTGFDIHVAK